MWPTKEARQRQRADLELEQGSSRNGGVCLRKVPEARVQLCLRIIECGPDGVKEGRRLQAPLRG
jgi:hypothetical protein